jgi:hypothetical protein
VSKDANSLGFYFTCAYLRSKRNLGRPKIEHGTNRPFDFIIIRMVLL